MCLLLCKEASCQCLFIGGTNQDAAFTVLRLRPAMNPNPTPSRHLFQERQESLELRRLSDLHFVDECRNEVFGILKCVAYRRQILFVFSGTSRVSVLCLIQRSSDCFSLCRLANKFVISHSFFE